MEAKNNIIRRALVNEVNPKYTIELIKQTI